MKYATAVAVALLVVNMASIVAAQAPVEGAEPLAPEAEPLAPEAEPLAPEAEPLAPEAEPPAPEPPAHEEAVVDRRAAAREAGRGFLYGAHIVSPIYLTDVRRARVVGGPSNERLRVGPGDGQAGGGVHARLGWELPLGFVLELVGGLAANSVDTQGVPDVSQVFMRADVGLEVRYMFFNDSPVVPFIGLGGQLRFLFFDWSSTASPDVDGAPTAALQAGVGLQFELSPYFAIEAGVTVDYCFAADTFEEGLLSLTPFLGATLYLYDEND